VNKLDVIRKAKSLFMKYNLHNVVEPFSEGLQNGVFMSELSQWRNQHPVIGYNDFYQETWDYERRYKLYEAIAASEQLFQNPMHYFEFGVAGGQSFRWWLERNKHPESRFFGFDTFEGLPEKWGAFEKGSMAYALESLQIKDERATFHKGLFQQTLVPFLENYQAGPKKLIHIDSDLFSAALFVLTQWYRLLKPGDILLFDEFAVPQHEFLAFKIFTESFYVNYDVIGAANNYLFVAVRIK
jgi:SAM-dependent methyltransferase